MTLTVGPRLQGFFEQVLPAIVTTLNDRGAPEMTPVWYEYRDGRMLLNGDKTRIWLARIRLLSAASRAYVHQCTGKGCHVRHASCASSPAVLRL